MTALNGLLVASVPPRVHKERGRKLVEEDTRASEAQNPTKERIEKLTTKRGKAHRSVDLLDIGDMRFLSSVVEKNGRKRKGKR
jgi:hypothetical protein